jgi:hypothetical protein
MMSQEPPEPSFRTPTWVQWTRWPLLLIGAFWGLGAHGLRGALLYSIPGVFLIALYFPDQWERLPGVQSGGRIVLRDTERRARTSHDWQRAWLRAVIVVAIFAGIAVIIDWTVIRLHWCDGCNDPDL